MQDASFDSQVAKGNESRQHPYRPTPAVAEEQPRVYGRAVASGRELLGAVALTAAVDFGLFPSNAGTRGGTALAIMFVVMPLVLLGAARRFRVTTRLAALLLVLLSVAARALFVPTEGTAVLGIAALFGVAVAMRHRRAFIADVVASAGFTLGTMHVRVWSGIAGLAQLLGGRGRKRRSLAPVLVPVALVSAFAGIFALANPLVGRLFGALINTLVVSSELRIVAWIAVLGLSMLMLRPAVFRYTASEDADDTDASTAVARSVAKNALVALNVLFLLYNGLDATYLWAGSPPPGISERLYAHQGAAWLTAALALLTVVVGVFFRGALAHDSQARSARLWAFAWLAQGLVLALGTFRRLGIHITTSGLSSIRILGMVGTALVVVGLLQVGYKLFAGRSFAWLLRRQLDALAIGATLFTLAPTHWISARINAVRVMEHRYQALVHVAEEVVEPESVTSFLPLLAHDDERIRRGIAALLLNERDKLASRRARLAFGDGDIASSRALATLNDATPALNATLDEADRAEAILYFEYIRNSSIEGEIAESEISKVPYAKSRADKLAESWILGRTGSTEAVPYAPVVNMDGTRRTTADIASAKQQPKFLGLAYDTARLTAILESPIETQRKMRFSVARTHNGSLVQRDVTVVFERAEGQSAWYVVEEHGISQDLF